MNNITRHEFSRPVHVPDFGQWTGRASLAAAYVGALCAGIALLAVAWGSDWAVVGGAFLIGGGVSGIVAWRWLVYQFATFEWWELKEFELGENDERRIPVNANGATVQEVVTKGIFSQREFASISREAEERGKLTRDRHGFSGSRYQDAVSWLLERGYIDTRNSWTDAGFSWLEIPSSSSSPRDDSEFSARGGG